MCRRPVRREDERDPRDEARRRAGRARSRPRRPDLRRQLHLIDGPRLRVGAVRGRRRDEVLAAADRPAGVNGAALLLEKRTRDAEVEVSEAERGDLAFHEALPVLELREKARLGQALAGPLEAGADFRAPRLGKFFHEPADAPRLDLTYRDDLAAACAAPLPARDDPALRARHFP